MDKDQIREKGKNAIGYNRIETLLGKKSADTALFYWVLGFGHAQSEQKVILACRDFINWAHEEKLASL